MKESRSVTRESSRDGPAEGYDLFVSYGHQDLDWVEDFMQDLEREYRHHIAKDLRVFFDKKDIKTSDMWDSTIREGMKRSSAMICFLSPWYFRSEYCGKEWDHFYGNPNTEHLPIFPVKIRSWEHIRDFTPRQEGRIKEIQEIQILDLENVPRGKARDTKLRELAMTIHETLSGMVTLTNIHAISLDVTPDNIKDLLERNLRDRQRLRRYPEKTPVFVLYTGGTVGMLKSNPEDPDSQLVVGSLDEIIRIKELDKLRELPFDIDFYSFDEPLDSSNIVAKDWIRIAKIINEAYDHYQGFVILHGTDTMVYTASALSFMFEYLEKPVILTGAERAPSSINSDAPRNITNAIRLAAPQDTEGVPRIPEVCIFFGRKLLRGNRAKKIQALSPEEGFDSPNLDLLGVVEDVSGGREDFNIRSHLLLPPPQGTRRLRVDTQVSEQVWIVEIFPNMNTKVLSSILSNDNVKGIVLKTYGTGNAPTIPGYFLAEIGKALEANKIVVNLTQCPIGHVEVRLFETNARLYDLGVINGGDMTSEAAFCKLSCLLGRFRGEDEKEVKEIKSGMQMDLRGELRYSAYRLSYTKGTIDPVFNGAEENIGIFDRNQIDHAKLRLHDIKIGGAMEGDVNIRILMNCQRIDEQNWVNYGDRVLGVIQAHWEGPSKELTRNLDVTKKVRELSDPNGRAQLHLVAEGKSSITFGALELSIFTKRT